MNSSGSVTTDSQIKNYLSRKGYDIRRDGCVKVPKHVLLQTINDMMEGGIKKERTETFDLRPEQREAVDMTRDYFQHMDGLDPERAPHFLWNCKMRFGKTFASYMLAKEMNWKRILILTFKPAVESAWEDDLLTHVAFEGWEFVSCRATTKSPQCSKDTPLVCFGSFQDLMGKSPSGGIKAKNEWIHLVNWDCVILDEYHYGAWREGAKDLFENDLPDFTNTGLDLFDEDLMPITTGLFVFVWYSIQSYFNRRIY